MSFQSDHLALDRVRSKTTFAAQSAIDAKTRRHIRYYADQPRPAIARRIAALNRERDVEQILETNASTLALTGAVLGTTVHRGFFLLTATVLGFLTQHAITGWCPPVPVFRKIGIRTRSEIDQEKYALKALRGDFRGLRSDAAQPAIGRVLNAVDA